MTILKWLGIAFLIPILLIILLIAVMNLNWTREIITEKISDHVHRKLTINGDVSIQWSLKPNIKIEYIQLENAAWSNEPSMLELAVLDVRVDLIELLKGKIILPEIVLTQPHIVLEKSSVGEANWELQTESDSSSRLEFPIVERLRIEDGRLVYRDLSANTEFVTTFSTLKNQRDDEEATELHAQGKLNGSPLTIHLNSGPLVALREAKAPYPFFLALQTGKTSIEVNGTMTEPLQLKGVDLQFVMAGPNPEQLSQILGLPMPSLPPYQLKGDLTHYENTWKIKNLKGRVGDSDLAGNISVELNEKIPFIKANLISKKIDLDDLGPLIGLTPGTGPGETASLAQKKEAIKQAASSLVFPKKPIDFSKLQNIHADIELQSGRVESKLPIDNLHMHVIIHNGHLIVSPLDFGVATGNIRSRLEFETRTSPVKSKIETKIRHVQLGEILRRFKIAEESVGLIGGQGIYWFRGNSVAEMLASADGGLLMLMTGGRLDGLLVELAGLDIGEALVALFDKDDNTEINCAFVDFPINRGIMNMATFVVDTQDTVFLGKGSIDLGKEQLDLIIDPHPKDLSLFSARAPLHIEGSFKEPTFTPGASAIVRGTVSLALLPSAPIVSLYSLLHKNHKNNKPEDIHCSSLVNAINEARQ